MMENKIIEEKIKEKTLSDPVMERFINYIIELEIKNKKFRAPYKEQIKKAVNERGKQDEI